MRDGTGGEGTGIASNYLPLGRNIILQNIHFFCVYSKTKHYICIENDTARCL
uniref:Uncharacterized protein n=1 Tax=Myoviridae sp. ct7CH26 TaxID=2827604 RepID=A0A8S5RSY4_9CAUD|nr:MAG TPA: hypothetical protein [Myoviridae sp. ct7CH26]